MKKLIALALVAIPMTMASAASANEYDQVNRRPIDNWLGNWFDHTFTKYHWDGSSSWYCAESFGGDCSCDSYTRSGSYPNNCSVPLQGDEGYGKLWGYQCGQWLSGRSYGTWGVCHQGSANLAWYINGNGSSIGSSIRGWSWSVGLFGVYGTDGGSGCY